MINLYFYVSLRSQKSCWKKKKTNSIAVYLEKNTSLTSGATRHSLGIGQSDIHPFADAQRESHRDRLFKPAHQAGQISRETVAPSFVDPASSSLETSLRRSISPARDR